MVITLSVITALSVFAAFASYKVGYNRGYGQGYVTGRFEEGFQRNLKEFRKTLEEILTDKGPATGCVVLTPGATWVATDPNEALGQAVTDASKDGTRDVLVKAKPGAVYTESFGKMPEVPREPVFIKEL